MRSAADRQCFIISDEIFKRLQLGSSFTTNRNWKRVPVKKNIRFLFHPHLQLWIQFLHLPTNVFCSNLLSEKFSTWKRTLKMLQLILISVVRKNKLRYIEWLTPIAIQSEFVSNEISFVISPEDLNSRLAVAIFATNWRESIRRSPLLSQMCFASTYCNAFCFAQNHSDGFTSQFQFCLMPR